MSKIIKAGSLLIAFLAFLLLAPGITAHASDKDIIWIGDSRSVGLAKGVLGQSPTAGTGGEAETVAHKGGFHFIAKCSQGYYWGKEAMNMIDDSDGDTIVIWLGVNDLGNKENYRTWLTNLTGSYNVYLISVTQCYSPSTISDERISDFNNMLKSIEGATYIDAYSLFEANAPATDSMGLHYGGSDYKRVFDLVKAELTGSPAPNSKPDTNGKPDTNSKPDTNDKVNYSVRKPVYKTPVDSLTRKRRFLVGDNDYLMYYTA